MTRSCLLPLLVISALAAPGPMAAQQVSPWIRYGKWATLALSVGLNLKAADAHGQANASFRQIERRCFEDVRLCATDASGRYTDAESERLYQRSLQHDRASGRWLLAGETALLGAAAMFIWELTRPKGPDENIPFVPRVQELHQRVGVGVEVRF